MKYSLNAIRKFVNIPKQTTDEEIMDALNSIGFEIEGFENKNFNKKTAYGKIVKCVKHPNADKLLLLEIDFKNHKVEIVTSAKVELNQIVGVFLTGSFFDGMVLSKRDFRGIMSDGMLMGFSEVIKKDFVADYLPQIVTTTDESLIGKDVLEHLNLKDTIIEIDILSNRSDIISYHSISHELAAFFNVDINTEFFMPKVSKESFETKIEFNDFNENKISGFESKVEVKESSWDDQLLLISAEIKPINNVVDLTQLSIIMFGQPTHAYDKEKIGNDITISRAKGKLNGVDNKEYDYDDCLVIKSDQKVVALAGAMGSAETSITNETTNVVFEIANFNTKEIRKTITGSKAFSLSSNTFSKKINTNVIEFVHNYFKSKLESFSNSVNIPKQNIVKIENNNELINKYAGFDFVNSDKFEGIKNKLRKLGFNFEGNSIITPFYRHDIELMSDIIEEYFRFYGYNNFNMTSSIVKSQKLNNLSISKNSISYLGYQEIITYSLRSEEYNKFNPFNFDNEFKLSTFISNDKIVYRKSISPSLIEIANYHIKRKFNDFSFFEVAYVNGTDEEHVGFVTTKSFTKLKEDILKILNGNKLVFKRTENKMLHEGVSADIYLDNEYIGFIGKTNPYYKDINVFIAEINLTALKENKNLFKSYSLEPIKVKDFNVLLDLKEDIGPIVEKIKLIDDVIEIKIKDIFIDQDKRKITLTILYNQNNTFDLINEIIS
ncbi:MAG: phenylalanine--tRNA ligase subunit beta [Mycoplasma sp.]|nr:phenylalanine--tRNA ligase subunit beta [Mycoplasma sp.]